jgi:hypothetical protein
LDMGVHMMESVPSLTRFTRNFVSGKISIGCIGWVDWYWIEFFKMGTEWG